MGNQHLRNAVQARMHDVGTTRLAAAEPVLLASSAAVPVRTPKAKAPGQHVWANAWTYKGDARHNPNAAKTDHSGAGFVLGGDVPLNGQVTLGGLFAYEDGKIKNGDNRNSRIDAKAYSLGGYLAAQTHGIEWQGGLIYSLLELDARRTITVPGLANVKADYKVQAFVEAAKSVRVSDDATLAPYLNVTHTRLQTKAVREKGSAAALNVQGQTDHVTQTTLGVRASYQLPGATPVTVTANLGWARAFGDTKTQTINRFGSTGNRFAIKGVDMAKNRALVGVGVEARLARNTTVSLGYDGQLASKYKDHAAKLQVASQHPVLV